MKSEDAKTMLLLNCVEICGGYHKDGTCKNCENDAAIEALDKQIPKKPVSKYKYRDGENVCPSCETENHCRIVMFWEKFCPDCGQAIDWGGRGMIVNIEEYTPHEIAELICLKCNTRWIGVYPQNTLLKDIECKCGERGFVIKTGQTLD